MHLTYWTKTKYVYVCDIFVTQYKRNTICFSKPIFKQFAQLSFLSLFLLEKCRDNSKFHEKSSSNHQSYTHTSIYVHIKIKLNRVKKKKKETQLNSSKIHPNIHGRACIIKAVNRAGLGPFNSQRSSFRTIFNHNRPI